MPGEEILAARALDSPAPGVMTSVGWGGALPRDLLDQSCRRVATASIVIASLWLIALVTNYAANAVTMHMKHATETPLPPSQRTELPIPTEFDDLVLACLAKMPDDRPATAELLARRLAEIRVPEPWTDDRAGRWWETHLSDLGEL